MEEDKNFLRGPDQLLPATTHTATVPDIPVLLRDAEAAGKRPPVSVPTLLRQTAGLYPDKTGLAVKRSGQWKKWSYREVQLNFTQEIEVQFHVLFVRCHTKNVERDLSQPLIRTLRCFECQSTQLGYCIGASSSP